MNDCTTYWFGRLLVSIDIVKLVRTKNNQFGWRKEDQIK